MTTMNIRASVIRSLHWMVLGKVATQALTWGITILVMRLLSPGDYGIMAIAALVGTFVGMVAEVGLGNAVIQARDIGERELRLVFGATLLLNAAAFTMLFLGAGLVAQFFDEPRLIPVMQFMSFEFLFIAFGVLPDAQLQREMRQKQRAIIDFAASMVSSVMTLALAIAGAGVWALVIGSMARTAARVIGLNIAAPYLRIPAIAFGQGRALFRFGGNVMLGRLLWYLYSQADILIAGKMLGKEALGFYSVGLHIASLPVQRLTAILSQVGFAAFSRVQEHEDRVRKYLLLSLRTVSLVAFPVLWGIGCIAPELVGALLGAKWESAIFTLQVMAIIMPLRVVSAVIASATDGLGRPDVSVRNLIFSCLIAPPLLLIGSHWDLFGLCVAWIIAAPLIFFQLLARSLAVLNLRLRDATDAISRPALSAAGMWLAVEGARITFVGDLPVLLRLAMLITVGACAYLAIATMLNRQGLRELLSMVRAQ